MEQSKKSIRPSKNVVRDLTESLGKMPPQALDMEESVLGALMLEKKAMNSVAHFLKPDHFYSDAHKTIYEVIFDLFKSSEPIDMRTVVAKLRKVGKLELVGGAYAIAEITSKVSSAASIEYHARVIMEHAIKRNLIELGSDIHQKAYDDTEDCFMLLEYIQGRFDTLSDGSLKGDFVNIRKLYDEGVKRIIARRKMEGVTGIPCGLDDVDELTAGFQKTNLIIIAARPGMGKTATVVCMLRNIAIMLEKPVAFFSLEMSGEELIDRMISAECEIDLKRIRNGNLTDEEEVKIKNDTQLLANAPLFIDDSPSLTILELRARARRLKATENIELIVVDYLQLMSAESERGKFSNNREQEIAAISRGLKKIAKELDIPVIALSQLSRGVESRGGSKRPMLSDLRESGAIEQDADIVMFLYRPEYYKIMQYDDNSSTIGVMEVIAAKNRNGNLDAAKVNFIGRYTKVKNFVNSPTSRTPKDFTQSQKPDDDDLPF